jgi:peptide/nickel transport system permease protein
MQRTGTALRRTAIQAVPTVLGIIVLCFLLLRLVPGDAADVDDGLNPRLFGDFPI